MWTKVRTLVARFLGMLPVKSHANRLMIHRFIQKIKGWRFWNTVYKLHQVTSSAMQIHPDERLTSWRPLVSQQVRCIWYFAKKVVL